MTKPKTRKKIIKLFQLYLQKIEVINSKSFDLENMFNQMIAYINENESDDLTSPTPYVINQTAMESENDEDFSFLKFLTCQVELLINNLLLLHSGEYIVNYDQSIEERYKIDEEIIKKAKNTPLEDIVTAFPQSDYLFKEILSIYKKVISGELPNNESIYRDIDRPNKALDKENRVLISQYVIAICYAPGENKLIFLDVIFALLGKFYGEHKIYKSFNEIIYLTIELSNSLCTKITTQNDGDKRTLTFNGVEDDYAFYVFDLAILLYVHQYGVLESFFSLENQKIIHRKIKELTTYCTNIEGSQPKKGSIDEEIKNTFDDALQSLVIDTKNEFNEAEIHQYDELIDIDMAKLAIYIINKTVSHEKLTNYMIGGALSAISKKMQISRPSEQFRHNVLYDAFGPILSKWLEPEIFQYLGDSELQNLSKNKKYEFEKEYKRNAIKSLINKFNKTPSINQIVNDYLKKTMK